MNIFRLAALGSGVVGKSSGRLIAGRITDSRVGSMYSEKGVFRGSGVGDEREEISGCEVSDSINSGELGLAVQGTGWSGVSVGT
jgi:hypothetical protein